VDDIGCGYAFVYARVDYSPKNKNKKLIIEDYHMIRPNQSWTVLLGPFCFIFFLNYVFRLQIQPENNIYLNMLPYVIKKLKIQNIFKSVFSFLIE